VARDCFMMSKDRHQTKNLTARNSGKENITFKQFFGMENEREGNNHQAN